MTSTQPIREGPFETTPKPNQRMRWWILGFCSILTAVSLALMPIAKIPLPPRWEFVPVVVTADVVSGCLTAFLLFGLFLQPTRRVAMLILGMSYLFSTVISVAYMLSFFPGMLFSQEIANGRLHGGIWLWQISHLAFPVLILAALLAEPRQYTGSRPRIVVTTAVAASVAAAIVASVLTAWELETLPPTVDERGRWTQLINTLTYVAAGLAMLDIIILCSRYEGRHNLYLWLKAALVAFFFEVVLGFLSEQRYTVGWYASRTLGFVGTGVLLMMFVGELQSLQTRLRSALRKLGRANRTLEQRVAERTRDLETANQNLTQALKDKNLLLKEVHHRVRNNLQAVDTLLALEAFHTPAAAKGLMDMRHRIFSLGLVHQKLMQSEEFRTIKLAEFVEELCHAFALSRDHCDPLVVVRFTHSTSNKNMNIDVEFDFAIPFGLLVAELLTKFFKHQFQSSKVGIIKVSLETAGNHRMALMVQDNGIKLPEGPGCNPIDQQIIDELVDQLDADLTINRDHGTEFRVTIPCPLRCQN